MSLLRGGPTPGRVRWLRAGLIGWLWSVPPGVVLLAAALLPWSETVKALALLFGAFGVFAPLYSWIGLLPGLTLAWLADRRGWFGWLVAPVIGALCGLLAARVIGGTGEGLGAVFGSLSLLVLRAALRIA